MENWIDPDTFDIHRFAKEIERVCQAGIKWELRKLEWIREERAKQEKADGEST